MYIYIYICICICMCMCVYAYMYTYTYMLVQDGSKKGINRVCRYFKYFAQIYNNKIKV